MKNIILFWTFVLSTGLLVGCSSPTSSSINTSTNSNGSSIKEPDPQVSLDNYVPLNLDAQEESYTLSPYQITPPRDVLREISYSGGQGGSWNSCSQLNFTEPGIFLASNDNEVLEWLGHTENMACGWKPGEAVSYFVTSPGGETSLVNNFTADEYGSVLFGYTVGFNSEPGQYVLMLRGNSGEINQNIQIRNIIGARVFYDWQKNLLYLYGFFPNEQVRLVVYKEASFEKYNQGLIGELWDIQNFSVDNSGQLIINLTEDNFEDRLGYVIIGEKSKEVRVSNDFVIGSSSPIQTSISTKASFPTVLELSQTKSVWNQLEYVDLFQPGEQFYTLNINREENLVWGFNWCAKNQETLFDILDPLTMDFIIDGTKIDKFEQVQSDFVQISNGWYCNRWRTILSNWDANPTHALIISYTLDSDIYDGQNTYSAGSYKQIINIHTE